MAEERKISEKQKRFCQEYMKDLNATQAAIRAGYKESNARQSASEILTKPYIQDYVAELQRDIRERSEITVDEVVQTLADILRFDIKELYGFNGGLLPIHDIPEAHRKSISGIESEQLHEWQDGEQVPAGVVKKIKTIDRLRAGDMLMKYFGAYSKDNTVNVTVEQPLFKLKDVSDNDSD